MTLVLYTIGRKITRTLLIQSRKGLIPQFWGKNGVIVFIVFAVVTLIITIIAILCKKKWHGRQVGETHTQNHGEPTAQPRKRRKQLHQCGNGRNDQGPLNQQDTVGLGQTDCGGDDQGRSHASDNHCDHMGALLGLFFGLIVVTFRAPQGIAGIGLQMFGAGAAGTLFRHFVGGTQSVPGITTPAIPILSKIPFLGQVFFSQNVLVYIAYLLVPAIWYILFKTPCG